MTKGKTRSLLALLLTFAMIATLVLGAMPAAAADEPVLRDGEAVIAADATAEEINAILSETLLANYDAVGDQEWQYAATNTYNTYTYGTILNRYYPVQHSETVWVSVAGETVTARVDDATFLGKSYAQTGDVQFAAIAAADAGTVFEVRIAGTEDAVKFTLLSDGTEPVVTPDPEPSADPQPSAEPDPEPSAEPAQKAVVTNSGETYSVAIAYNKDLSWNYSGIEQNIIDAVAPGLGLKENQVTVKRVSGLTEYYLSGNAFGLHSISEGKSTIHLTFKGNDTVEAFDIKVTIDLSDQRPQPVIVLKEDASVTYNKDGATTRQNVYSSAIDFSASTLPEGVTADDFTIEYYATASLNTDSISGTGDVGSVIGGGISSLVTEKTWFDVAGGQYKKLLINTYDVPVMGAGEQQIRISLPESATYKAATVEGDLTVNKASVSVRIRPAIIYPEQALPENFVTTSPEDDFTIFTFYAGISTDLAPTLYIQLPSNDVMNLAMKVIDPLYAALHNGKTLTQRFNEGLTVGDLREILVEVAGILNDALDNALVSGTLETLGINTEMIQTVLTAIEKLPGVFDNWAVALGTPSKAGIYGVAAVAVNKNYNPGFGVGVLVVKQHLFGVSLAWNQTISGSLTVEQAANFDFGAHAVYQDTVVSQNVKYTFTGFTSAGKLYLSSTAPTEAGKYLCTAYSSGGNYLALPMTRSITITA